MGSYTWDSIILTMKAYILVSVLNIGFGSPVGIGLGGHAGVGGGHLVGHGGGHVVRSAPLVHSAPVHVDHYDEHPDPFKFEYGVHDDKYYTDFSEHRSGDEYGNIVGEYQVALPDGRIQYVKYTADGNYGGTVMEVSYKGEARHPDIVAHGHGGHGGVGIGGGSGGIVG